MLTPMQSRQAGVSLIELMVGILVGMIVVAGSFAMFSITSRAGNDNIRALKLNQELQMVADLIGNEIRRSGYLNQITTTNPYSTVLTPTNNCLLYGYDSDLNGSDNPGEWTGFRRDNDNIVRVRTPGVSITDCANGTWSPLTDPQTVAITALTFQQCYFYPGSTQTAGACPSCSSTAAEIPMRYLLISLTGSLPNDPSTTRSIQWSERLRNDLFANACN